jgi:hypothetical protein
MPVPARSAQTLGGTPTACGAEVARSYNSNSISMVVLLGSHLAAVLVGIGMSVVVFACGSLASRMNERAATSAPLAAFGWHSSRFIVGLLCAAAIALPWLYLLVELRASLSLVICLVASAAVSAYLFVKHRVFGRVTVVR